MSWPSYVKTYTIRVAAFVSAYMVILFSGRTLASSYDLSEPVRIALALLTALPICGIFWALYRALIECDDEYQRFLLVKQLLWATAGTLVVVTVWNFLKVYDVVSLGPQWVAVMWFAMFGLAGPIARWRA